MTSDRLPHRPDPSVHCGKHPYINDKPWIIRGTVASLAAWHCRTPWNCRPWCTSERRSDNCCIGPVPTG